MGSRYATVTSTVALVVALTGTGAWATGLIGSKQIRRGAVRAPQIHDHAVKAAKLGRGAVGNSALGVGSVQAPQLAAGSVTASAVSLPPAQNLSMSSEQTASPGNEFAKVADMGTYTKQDGTSALQVTWTGSASADFSPCIFELRVDGQPTDGGEVYVQNSTTQSVSDTALFAGLPTGDHTIEIWARSTLNASYPCTVAPAAAEIGQSVVVQEIVS